MTAEATTASEEAPGSEPSPPSRVLPTTTNGRWLVAGVLAVALVARVIVAIWVNHRGYAPLTDALDYDRIAASIADGHGFGAASLPGAVGAGGLRAPLYPFALSLVYMVVGTHRYAYGLLENAVFGVGIVALIGVVGTQLFGRRVGFIALAVAAVHPTLMLFGTSLQHEPLLVVLELATLASALQYRVDPRLRWAIATGAALGLSILTREIGIWMIPVVVLLLWTERPRWTRAALAAPLVALVIGAAVSLPWTVRNAQRFSAFVPVTTTTGVAFAGTYNQTSYDNTADPALWIPPWTDPAMANVVLAHQNQNEAEIDQALRSAAIDFARDHPAYVPKVMFWNTVRLFDLKGTGAATFAARYLPYPHSMTVLAVLASYVLLVLALVAIFGFKALRRGPWALWLFPALAWFNFAILSGNIRYRATIEPFTVLLAAFALNELAARYSKSRTTAA